MTDQERIKNLEEAVDDLFYMLDSSFIHIPKEDGNYSIDDERRQLQKMAERFRSELPPTTKGAQG